MKVLPAGTIKRVHVDQHVIRRNKREGRADPPVTVQTSKGSLKSEEVRIDGPSVVRYTPGKPLSCGATVYVETTSSVEVR